MTIWNEEEYLTFLKRLFEVTEQMPIDLFLWGGLTIDVYSGRILRPHHDIDAFATNLSKYIPELVGNFNDKNYIAKYDDQFNILKIRSNNYHASIKELVVLKTVAEWKHIGSQDSVYFPSDWLDKEPRTFYGIQLYTSGQRFEYSFKKIACDLNPKWEKREKDIKALEFLTDLLISQSIEIENLLEKIWSYNPYWLKQGYDGFSPPVLMFPKLLT